ncbi:MAG TPA: hypothetical protein VFU47_12690, partial [Armatimonadota bacterium]|nr:hypothetical protein [Armatimonadota bacterium]
MRDLILRRPYLAFAAAGLLLAAPFTAALRSSSAAESAPAIGCPAPVDLPGLPNVVRLNEKLYTGAQPEGDEGFRSLRKLGIRTILSVDGTPPDVKTAHRFGFRYAHLPFGYAGCPRPQAARIIRAVRDLPGPIYLHCHHGKHRAPAAGALVRRALDGISPQQAVKELERAGTGKNYLGLYQGARDLPPTPEEIEAVRPEFPEISPTPPLMTAMV